MAITLAQAGTVNAGGSPTYPGAVTAGRLLVALVAQAGTTPSTITSNGTGWVEATGARAIASAASKTQVFYKLSASGSEGASPPVFNNAGFSQLLEFSGGGAFAIDQTGNAVDQTSGGNVTAAGADIGKGRLVVTADFWRVTTSGTDTTNDSYNNGATATNTANNDSTSGTGHYRFAYGITTGNSAADKNTVTFVAAINHSAYSLVTFYVTVSGTSAISELLSLVTAGVRKRLGVSAISETATFVTSAVRKTFGSSSLSEALTFTTAAVRKTFGTSAISETVTFTTAGTRTVYGASAMTSTFTTTTAGTRKTFGSSALGLTDTLTTDGTVGRFGASHMALTDTLTTDGVRTTFGASSLSETLTFTTSGTVGEFGVSTLDLTFTLTTDGTVTPEYRYPAGTGGTLTLTSRGRLTENTGGRITNSTTHGLTRNRDGHLARSTP